MNKSANWTSAKRCLPIIRRFHRIRGRTASRAWFVRHRTDGSRLDNTQIGEDCLSVTNSLGCTPATSCHGPERRLPIEALLLIALDEHAILPACFAAYMPVSAGGNCSAASPVLYRLTPTETEMFHVPARPRACRFGAQTVSTIASSSNSTARYCSCM
jgi:hypothetical protein